MIMNKETMRRISTTRWQNTCQHNDSIALTVSNNFDKNICIQMCTFYYSCPQWGNSSQANQLWIQLIITMKQWHTYNFFLFLLCKTFMSLCWFQNVMPNKRKAVISIWRFHFTVFMSYCDQQLVELEKFAYNHIIRSPPKCCTSTSSQAEILLPHLCLIEQWYCNCWQL